jgi:hypothetical protein
MFRWSFFAGVLILLGCTKNTTQPVISKSALLVQRWNVDSIYYLQTGNLVYHDDLDSIYTFYNNGFLIRKRHSQYTGFPLQDTLTFKLQSDSLSIVFHSVLEGAVQISSDTAKIISITDTTLIFKHNIGWIAVLSR